FSSRRRHTRFSRDWSSDVCSSDLVIGKSLVLEYIFLVTEMAKCQTSYFRKSLIVISTFSHSILSQQSRSEERRVVTDCKSRTSPTHHTKKMLAIGLSPVLPSFI